MADATWRGPGAVDPRLLRALTPSEKQVQAAVMRLYTLAGCAVYNLSQARATNQTPGLPDLYVFHPATGAAWWHEVKKPGGRPSPAQREFQARCAACGVAYLLGGLEEAEARLRYLRGRP